MAFHIREAVELGHAERIGHGVDVLYEDRPFDLLREMAAKHIDVEINLTSNDGILGVKGTDHPLAAYMATHVPFSLSTDDEGVSRIDLTHEYARAVEEQNLSYADLKHSARDSLEHSFLAGESLWAGRTIMTTEVGVRREDQCGQQALGRVPAVSECEREGCRAVGVGAAVRGIRSECSLTARGLAGRQCDGGTNGWRMSSSLSGVPSTRSSTG